MDLPPFNTREASLLKTCFNGLNALSGIGLITIPYTLSQAGWSSLGLLLVMAIVTCYSGLLIKWCIDSNPSIKTYPDIGSYTSGHKGKLLVSTFMHMEVYLVPTGFLILEGDNLHKLFPNFGFQVGGHYSGGKIFSTMLAGLVIFPSIWLKDLNLLSFISAGGVLSSIIIIRSILWVGAVDGVGFSGKGKLFDLSGFPTALSLYAFCYGGHTVFPNLYSSMKDRSQFSKVLLISLGLTTLSHISMAVAGYLMLGLNVLSQSTLNLPTSKVSSKIAICTTLAGPIAKYALLITPIVEAIENHSPSKYNIWPISSLTRTLVLVSSVIVALVFLFFGSQVTLVGAILNVTVAILLPCICYLKIFEAYRRWGFELVIIVGIIVMAIAVGVMGTYSSIRDVQDILRVDILLGMTKTSFGVMKCSGNN